MSSIARILSYSIALSCHRGVKSTDNLLAPSDVKVSRESHQTLQLLTLHKTPVMTTLLLNIIYHLRYEIAFDGAHLQFSARSLHQHYSCTRPYLCSEIVEELGLPNFQEVNFKGHVSLWHMSPVSTWF